MIPEIKEKDNNEFIISSTEPVGRNRKKLWIQKGKNLAFCNDTSIYLGLATTFNNSKIIIDGTSNGAGDFYRVNQNHIKLNPGTYTCSITLLSGNITATNVDAAFLLRDKNGAQKLQLTLATLPAAITKKTTFTISDETTITYELYVNGSGMNFNNCVIGLQVEEGSNNTTFEEYKPIKIYELSNNIYKELMDSVVTGPQPNGAKLWIKKSNNLFNLDNKIPKMSIDGTGTFVTEAQANTYYVKVKPGKTYTLTKPADGQWVYTLSDIIPYLGYTVGSRTVIASDRLIQITVPSGKNYFCLRDWQNSPEDNTNVMMVEGTVEKPFEKYVDNEILIYNSNNGYETIYDERNYKEYSLAEKRIGTWTDGKPIYRKTITGTLPTITQGTMIDELVIIDTYLEFVVSVQGFIYSILSGNNTYQIPIEYLRHDNFQEAITYNIYNNAIE